MTRDTKEMLIGLAILAGMLFIGLVFFPHLLSY